MRFLVIGTRADYVFSSSPRSRKSVMRIFINFGFTTEIYYWYGQNNIIFI